MSLSQLEAALIELERRLWTINTSDGYSVTVASVERNPKKVNDLLPQINIFELEDTLEENLLGGAVYRIQRILIEFWQESDADDDGGDSQLVASFLSGIRYVLFNDGYTLGGACEYLEEQDRSPVIRPPIGKLAVGRGVTILLHYKDNRTYVKQ